VQQDRQQIANTYPTNVTNLRSVFLPHIEIQHIQPQDWALWFELDFWFCTHLLSDYYILFIYEDYITHTGSHWYCNTHVSLHGTLACNCWFPVSV